MAEQHFCKTIRQFKRCDQSGNNGQYRAERYHNTFAVAFNQSYDKQRQVYEVNKQSVKMPKAFSRFLR